MKISAVVEILFERYFIAPVVTLDAVKELNNAQAKSVSIFMLVVVAAYWLVPYYQYCKCKN